LAPAIQNQNASGQVSPQSAPVQAVPDQTVPSQDAGSQVAQPPDPSQEPANDAGVFVFKTQVEEVILRATVVDDQRRLIPNLPKESFTIYEDGRPQVITSFRREDVPVAIGIVVDNSGSMRDKRERVAQAMLNLVRTSNPDDEVFVVNFGEDYYLDQDFTGDVNLLRAALRQEPMRGETALYDAITASAKHLKGSAKLERRVLLVITDGQDNASQETLPEAVRHLQEQNGPALYAIGLLEPGERRPGREPLAALAESTGGVAFFPQSLTEVDGISRTIARDIRSQYTIGYKSTNPQQNGGYRRIHVDASAKGYPKLTVRTRSGYYPGETPR
jgi:VWFA-related protein